MTDAKRDHYRQLGGSLGETYYSIATTLGYWESGGCGKVPARTTAKLRSKLAKVAKALDAAHAALKEAREAEAER